MRTNQNILVVDKNTDEPFVWMTLSEREARSVYFTGAFTMYKVYPDSTESEIDSYDSLNEALEDGVVVAIEVGHYNEENLNNKYLDEN